MVLSTRTRALPFSDEIWEVQYGTQAEPLKLRPNRKVETTTSEWGMNFLKYINSDEFSEKSKHHLRKHDWGHYFYSKKTFIDERSVRFCSLSGTFPGNLPNLYSGGLLALSPTLIEKLGETELTESQLTQVLYGAGATAISRTIPHSSALDLGVTLGELRQDGLPRLPALTKLFGDLRGLPKSAASEYLNYEFAWKPLIKDVLGILEVAAQSERIYEQYLRDSGRAVRRRYSFPDDHRAWTDVKQNVGPYPALNAYWWNGGATRGLGELSSSFKRTSRTWFSGSYRYHIPQYEGIRGDIAEWQRQARVLYGLDVTPELLWQLTRWSWLVDWFANFGDILANISALGKDNLTLHYGYIMRETNIEADYTWNSYNPTVDPANDKYLRRIRTKAHWNQKIRLKASPYGFGLDPGVFSPRQWAILTALGITMAPNKLG